MLAERPLDRAVRAQAVGRDGAFDQLLRRDALPLGGGPQRGVDLLAQRPVLDPRVQVPQRLQRAGVVDRAEGVDRPARELEVLGEVVAGRSGAQGERGERPGRPGTAGQRRRPDDAARDIAVVLVDEVPVVVGAGDPVGVRAVLRRVQRLAPDERAQASGHGVTGGRLVREGGARAPPLLGRARRGQARQVPDEPGPRDGRGRRHEVAQRCCPRVARGQQADRDVRLVRGSQQFLQAPDDRSAVPDRHVGPREPGVDALQPGGERANPVGIEPLHNGERDAERISKHVAVSRETAGPLEHHARLARRPAARPRYEVQQHRPMGPGAHVLGAAGQHQGEDRGPGVVLRTPFEPPADLRRGPRPAVEEVEQRAGAAEGGQADAVQAVVLACLGGERVVGHGRDAGRSDRQKPAIPASVQ
ncbi:hypothetical protein LUW76_08980 [Actinomadura madurae]|uniref:hypothetical protein n=1 Tax=Actinomadura madurae TaxID=1993 RepID=UPI0020262B75|nr:hypothetical protein [Actinomadura madurae]URN01902.1 hypothetical protein LUW76_08980 [Actinomadura madurae]